jgi:DNA-binding transcriptional regulator/RsmH inhibitor MraZ
MRKFNDTIVITLLTAASTYIPDEWIKFEEEIWSSDRERKCEIFNAVFAHAAECSVDKQGKLLIPNSLRPLQLEKMCDCRSNILRYGTKAL